MVAVVVFPMGFSAPEVREVCGPNARSYSLGECGVRWAFLLAIIAVVDAVVLSALAFVLGTRSISSRHQINNSVEQPLYQPGSMYKPGK